MESEPKIMEETAVDSTEYQEDFAHFWCQAIVPLLTRALAPILLDAHRVEDTLADTFLRVWRAYASGRLARFEQLRNHERCEEAIALLWAYSRKTALRQTFRSFRRERKNVESAVEPASGEPSPLETLLQEEKSLERNRRIQTVLAALPERYRAILLIAAEGGRYEEFAELLQVTVPTVKSRLCRAKRAFYREWTKRFAEPLT